MSDITLISSKDVNTILTMDKAISLVEDAFKSCAAHEADMPAKIYLDLPEFMGDFRAMPAYSKAIDAAGLKWVNSHPNNRALGVPAVMGSYLLCNPKTGEIKSFLEATNLTAIRTGAAGAVAAKACLDIRPKSAVFIGAGVQAYYQFLGLNTLYDLDEIIVCDLNQETLEAYKAKITPLFNGNIRFETSIEKAVSGAELIVTTTPGTKPLIELEWLTPGVHINAIGADAPGKQEVSTQVVKAAKVIVDDMEQASHSGEINVPLSSGNFSNSQILGTLGELLIGKLGQWKTNTDITLFDSTGLAVQDLFCASYVYNQIKENPNINPTIWNSHEGSVS